jgi:hypothetical protein
MGNYTYIFLIGFLLNAILMRTTGRISMEDIGFPISIFVAVILSFLLFNRENIVKKVKEMKSSWKKNNE